jgi:uncharacterized cupin superfamily protein
MSVLHLVHWDEVPRHRVELAPLAAAWTDLGAAAGSRGIGLKRIEMGPGERPTPAHVHGAEEEIFYVLAGSGLSWQAGRTMLGMLDEPHTHSIGPGDCLVHLPAGPAHTLVAGPDGLEVLAFGTRARVEVGVLPRTGVAWLWPAWVEIGTEGHPWQREAGAGDLPLPAPSERPASIVNLHDPRVRLVEEQRRTIAGVDRMLGEAAGSERCGLNHVTTDAGKLSVPPHCHSAEEELFVVLEGEAVAILGDEELPVRPGSVLARPPGTGIAHPFRAGAEPLVYLVFGTREPNDIAYYPRSGKVYLRGVGVLGRIEPVDYWEGED